MKEGCRSRPAKKELWFVTGFPFLSATDNQFWQPKLSPNIAKCPLEGKTDGGWEPLVYDNGDISKWGLGEQTSLLNKMLNGTGIIGNWSGKT